MRNFWRIALLFLILPGTEAASSREPDRASKGEEVIWPWNYDVGAMEYHASWVREADLTLKLNADPVLRTIVCRLAISDFTFDTMVSATGLPKERVQQAVNVLEAMDLVRWRQDSRGTRYIVSASDDARLEMASWADKWCSADDACGVGR